MKQVITLKRTEIRTIVLDVPQALNNETLTKLANASICGAGSPAFGATTSHTLSDWALSKAEPSGECASAKRKGKR